MMTVNLITPTEQPLAEPGLRYNQPCLLTMLDDNVRRFPQHLAVSDHQGSLSYRDFQHAIRTLASGLNRLLAGDVSCVGLFCEPSAEMICSTWGVLAAGRSYLPLAPDYPAERIRYMIEDSGVKVLLTQPHLVDQLTALAPQGVIILTPEAVRAQAEEGPAEVTLAQRNRLAYMIYTSGSTGKPKGVMVSYANIAHQMAWLKKQFGFGPRDRILQKTPASFDAAQWEILAPAFGSHVVVAPRDCYRDPDAMIDVLLREKITVLQCVPTLLQALVDHPLFTDCQALNQVFSGGEILTRQLAQAFFQRLPHAALTNLYGPTECTINSSWFTLQPALLPTYPDAIPIGKPVDNLLYHVLDSCGEPVAPGETGELYISGLQVARGYFERPELTQEKFVTNRRKVMPGHDRLYRTGDRVRQDASGNTHFAGRMDNQIKLRGYRVELDEIRLAIEHHHWVKTAAVLVSHDPRSGYQTLVACVELDKHQAALMDQDNHDLHHVSKSNKLQVKAQLANAGCREFTPAAAASRIALAGKVASAAQRADAFGRKTYRFFERDEPVTPQNLIDLLGRQPAAGAGRTVPLTADELGGLLRNAGQFISESRLLPKYAYASPGALYATQLYLELSGHAGLAPAIYYYHPIEHALYPVAPLAATQSAEMTLHFIGKRDAIAPVYKNNLREVLEMETGHMLGLFDELLPPLGLNAERAGMHQDALPDWYDGSHEDDYLGGYAVTAQSVTSHDVHVDFYLQLHQQSGALSAGLYRYQDGALHFLTGQRLARKDVIAINQRVFERAQFGISIVCNGGDRAEHYVLAGREMHRLQSNGQLLGLMSSGYSSKSNHDLPAATRLRAILANLSLPMESLYFCVGGPISAVQYHDEGMNEDRIHMQGPVELLKEDLAAKLPQYMIPNQVIILDQLPQTANGKVDHQALAGLPELTQAGGAREMVPLRTETERKIGDIWCAVMKWESVSANDNFFECGGNSLTAVALINRINQAFAIRLPLQTIFQTPDIPGLAAAVEKSAGAQSGCSRLIALNNCRQRPVFCWPGLGGYPFSLRLLATRLPEQRAFYGIQAQGINPGEIPLPTISEMARQDIARLKALQPSGPYTLWGYSFGARVAFETAAQLEAMGDEVDALYLLAPGAPVTQMERERVYQHQARFDNPVFLAILFSVFARQVEGPLLDRCLASCRTRAEFIAFIVQRFPLLQADMVERIIRVVETTYAFSYQFRELQDRQLNAPVTIIKAQGDHYSFLENAPAFTRQPPTVVELNVDHYAVLEEQGVNEICQLVAARIARFKENPHAE